MRTNLGLKLGTLITLITLLVIYFQEPSPDTVKEQILSNTESLLRLQELDITEFENQLSVYTNPFAIDDQVLFEKRVFLNGGLIYWNDNSYLPEYSSLKKPDTLYTITDDFGLKLIKRREIVTDRDLIEIFSIIPISFNPPVSNQYLKYGLNEHIFENYQVEIDPRGDYTIQSGNVPLFRMNILAQSQLDQEWVEGVLLLVILLLLGIILWRELKISERSLSSRFFYLLLFMVGSRLILFIWSRFTVSSLDLFNPIYFTVGAISPTLGDLLLHGVFGSGICITLYLLFFTERNSFDIGSRKSVDWLLNGVVVISNLAMAYLCYSATWMILEHSQVELDISKSIFFDELRVVGFLFLIVIGIIFLIVFAISQLIRSKSTISKLHFYAFFLFCYTGFGFITGSSGFLYGLIVLALWLTVDFFELSKVINSLRYQTFILLVLVYTSVACISAYAIYKHTEKDELISKGRFANRLLIKNDILGEFYLSQITEEISQDRYVRTRLMSKLLARQNIREKIKRQFLSSYFKKYDINVYLFESDGSSLQEDVSTGDYEAWKAKYGQELYKTDYTGIYFIEDREENVRNKYVCFLEIGAYGNKVGYVILDLTLKKFIPSSVFPELLLESKYYMGSKEEFDYGVFKNGEVLYKQGRVSFENKLTSSDFRNEQLYDEGVEQDGYHYFGLRTADNRILIIVSPTYQTQSILANFSFIFLLMFFVTGFVFVLLGLFASSNRFNLSTKIQLYLGLSFMLPMIVVSVALINTLNRSYREEIDRNFRKRSFNIAENLIDQSEAFFTSKINIDEYANEIAKAASIAQSDLNIYDVKGRLVTTSQPEIFRLGLLSELLYSDAYYKINYKREQNLIAEQNIGALDFKTSYTALRSYQDGRLLAILAMPYFDSKNHLRRQQVEVFNNLVVIFSMIFLISLTGGNFIVGQLVRPLKTIGDKISKTSLQETNQPIQYESQDEIGSLVKEYNKMLIKLDESKEALAASQKESAWKEIARQVAHEIKNPLTPMRLKIQQMMKGLEPDSKQYKTFITLISQVDSLSSIADSFSEFAKMPAPHNEEVDLVSLVDNVINLYHNNEVDIRRFFDSKEAKVYVDPKIFGRIITNIILNAIQAKMEGRPVIKVSMTHSGNKVMLAIQDNGVGISEDQKEKIFTPYFSTKSKGSGIGLAVAKKGIENAGGNIWFDSEEGEGTTFYISLPLI
ncbi:MAG: HAMP domain-containing sensor histidine kinase [Marinoscillum sp.]